jgi:hypothetical protein
MKSYLQLAKAAYEAYCKMAREIGDEGPAVHAPQWAELDRGTQQCWLAATKQLWAEFALTR